MRGRNRAGRVVGWAGRNPQMAGAPSRFPAPSPPFSFHLGLPPPSPGLLSGCPSLYRSQISVFLFLSLRVPALGLCFYLHLLVSVPSPLFLPPRELSAHRPSLPLHLLSVSRWFSPLALPQLFAPVQAALTLPLARKVPGPLRLLLGKNAQVAQALSQAPGTFLLLLLPGTGPSPFSSLPYPKRVDFTGLHCRLHPNSGTEGSAQELQSRRRLRSSLLQLDLKRNFQPEVDFLKRV